MESEYTPTEHPILPERMLNETYMVNGKEYRVGGQLHAPKDPSDKSLLLFTDLDPTHDIFVRATDLKKEESPGQPSS